MNAFHIVRVQRQLHDVAVLLNLAQRVIHPPERLFGLKAAGIVLFGNEHREEERAFPAFPRTLQVPLSIGHAGPHTATVIELAVQRVHMSVKHQRRLCTANARAENLRRCPVGGA